MVIMTHQIIDLLTLPLLFSQVVLNLIFMCCFDMEKP